MLSIILLWLNTFVDFLMQLSLNRDTPVNIKVSLYTNNHTPVVTDVIGAFTICSLSGYADVTLTTGSWTGSTSSGIADYTYPTITFTFAAYAGGTTIYGVVLRNATSGAAWKAALLDTPFAVPAGGGTLSVSLEEILKQCP